MKLSNKTIEILEGYMPRLEKELSSHYWNLALRTFVSSRMDDLDIMDEVSDISLPESDFWRLRGVVEDYLVKRLSPTFKKVTTDQF